MDFVLHGCRFNKVKLKPNENFDFIVLLNSKDTCMTRIQALPFNDFSKINPAIHDTIPFELTTFNNIKIKAILNKKDSLNLMFDSATNGLLLTEAAIKEKNLETEIEKKENILQFGNQTFDSLEIYSVLLNGQGCDGRFGWDLFNGKVVEIDYDKNIFVVHSQLPKIDEGYAKLKLEHIYNSFCIEAELQIKNKKFKNRFLFDTGYQRTIMLDTALVDEQNYPKDLPIIKKVMMRNGAGVELPVITFNNEKLNIGNSTLFDIPVQLLNNQQVVKYKAHILGNEVLKRFNTIYDFHKDVVYLKPNSLANLEYTDAKL